VINPTITKAGLAKDLGITRSAITQIWNRLEQERKFVIRSSIDYKSVGLRGIFGWAETNTQSDSLSNFAKWLRSNPLIHTYTESSIASKMNYLVGFEAIVPMGDQSKHLINQLERFRKRPYSLNVSYDEIKSSRHTLNLGLFDGSRWDFSSNFRFGAAIDAAKDYAEVLPPTNIPRSTYSQMTSIHAIVIALALKENYHIIAPQIAQLLNQLNLEVPSGRTLRRHLSTMRDEIATPYVHIENIGLKDRVMICVEEVGTTSTGLLRVLNAQATTFPSANVSISEKQMLIETDVPTSKDYLTISEILSHLSDSDTSICTFIAKKSPTKKQLEPILSYLKSSIQLRKGDDHFEEN
ncbi:MAG: hypothetical protein ACTSUO_00340, partial [Candidatus Thorarchaeota archaeon]